MRTEGRLLRLVERDLAGLAGSFLGDLSPAARNIVLQEASLIDVPRGRPILADTPRQQRLAFVLEGSVRTFITLPSGKQLTVRLARARSMVTTLTSTSETPVRISLRAMTPCALVELNVETLRNLMQTDYTVAAATVAEITRRIEDTYRAFAFNVAGVIRERVAAYLLDATQAADDGRLVTQITQLDLAEALGTAREVVGRALRALKADGLVRTGRGGIELIDAARLIDIAGPWWQPGDVLGTQPKMDAAALDSSPHAVVAVDSTGEIVYANRRVEPVFGWLPDALVGRPIATLLPNRHVETHHMNVQSFMAEPRAFPMGHGRRGLHGRRADGSEFPVEVSLLPVEGKAGVAVFATIVDVTYRAALRTMLESRAPSRTSPAPGALAG